MSCTDQCIICLAHLNELPSKYQQSDLNTVSDIFNCNCKVYVHYNCIANLIKCPICHKHKIPTTYLFDIFTCIIMISIFLFIVFATNLKNQYLSEKAHYVIMVFFAIILQFVFAIILTPIDYVKNSVST